MANTTAHNTAQPPPSPSPTVTATPALKKGLQIRRALKSAARLPARVSSAKGIPSLVGGGRGGARNSFAPLPGELPIVVCRLQVVGCRDLLAKDRNGFSDPFVVASVLRTRHQTPVAKRNVNPTYQAKDATFDFPLYLSLADRLGVVELIVWDKDVLTKEYLGEAALPLEDWFVDRETARERPFAFEDAGNVPFSVPLLSTRQNTHATGSVQIKLGFVLPGNNTQNLLDFDEVFGELVKRSRPSLVSAPPTEGVGTVRSHQGGPAYEDDGGLSSDEGDDDDDDDDFVDALDATPPRSAQHSSPATTPPISTATTPSPLEALYTPPAQSPIVLLTTPATPPPESREKEEMRVLSASPDPASGGASPVASPTPTPTPMPTSPGVKPSTHKSPGFIPKMKFPRRIPGLSGSSSSQNSGASTPVSGAARPVSPTALPPSPPAGELVRAGTDVGVVAQQKEKKKFRKSWGGSGSGAPAGVGGSSGSGSGSGSDNGPTVGAASVKKKVDYSLEAANDIVGIVMLEIQSAEDLPRLKNMTRTGWDMDPFVVVSFGKKVFRTRVIRHSRNPVWEEKLLFHVRRYETSFKVQLTILDWDKLSSNDHIGDASFDVKELVQSAPQPDARTGLYASDEDGDHPMKEFKLGLSTAKEMPWEAKHNPAITFRAKYQPYDALRQRFWRQYLKQYDTDDTGHLSHLEITSMLDSLGSTLTRSTVNSFFMRFDKKPHDGELTVEEAIQCLETELGRPDSEKKRVDADDGLPDSSVSATPVLMVADHQGRELALDQLDFSGPPSHGGPGAGDGSGVPSAYATEPSEQPLAHAAAPRGDPATPLTGEHDLMGRQVSYSSSDAEESSGSNTNLAPAAPAKKKLRFRRGKKAKSESSGSGAVGRESKAHSMSDDSSFERVINVKNCPLCHRPRLNSKAEMDIVTHLAICASQDWNKVDRIVVGNFVTASQAQRKWYTKIISKVSSGDYRLGANSANIIVQNRITGQLEEEKMQVYVRLGIRLLYKGAKSRMEGGRARRLLKSLSIKQGIKYDAPESARDIPTFIDFHGLKIDEILDPLESFKNFNQFFYRKLKPSARPIEEPENQYRLVSAADCRLMTFETVSEATRLWIKGREFTVARLLGDAYKSQAEKYVGGALAIFRLAPQDYHRFHSPVEGTIGSMTYIAGEYYTVNPQAIRTALDVYGENARKIVPIDSPQFGRVMAVCIGAMMVGSIQTTVEEGEHVDRGQEFGYFAFGGSTIVILFEKGVVEWDEDLLINGRASLETLVRVGMGIGTGRRSHAPATLIA